MSDRRRRGMAAGLGLIMALCLSLAIARPAWAASRTPAGAAGAAGACAIPGPGPVPAPQAAPGNPASVFCMFTGNLGWSGQTTTSDGSPTEMTCDGASLPFGNCFPGLHYFFWVSDYYLGWAARGYLGSAVSLLVNTPNIAQIAANSPDLGSLYATMRGIAQSLAGLFIALALFRYFLVSIGQGGGIGAYAGLYRAIIGMGLLKLSPDLINIWFSGLTALTGAIVPQNFSVFPLTWLDENATQPLYYLSQGASYYSHGSPYIANMGSWWVSAFLVVLLLLFLILIFAIFIRMSGLFSLVALFVAAPLCIVTWILPEFSGIARWWWASFITYSLWGVGYAVVLLTTAAILGAGAFGAVFGYGGLSLSPDQVDFFQMLIAIAGLLTMARVPELLEGMLGGLSVAAGGAAGMRAGAVKLARTAITSGVA